MGGKVRGNFSPAAGSPGGTTGPDRMASSSSPRCSMGGAVVSGSGVMVPQGTDTVLTVREWSMYSPMEMPSEEGIPERRLTTW